MVCTLTCVRFLKEVVKSHMVQLPKNVIFRIKSFSKPDETDMTTLHKVHFHMHFKLDLNNILSWIVLFIIDPFCNNKIIHDEGVIKLQGDLLPLSSGR